MVVVCGSGVWQWCGSGVWQWCGSGVVVVLCDMVKTCLHEQFFSKPAQTSDQSGNATTNRSCALRDLLSKLKWDWHDSISCTPVSRHVSHVNILVPCAGRAFGPSPAHRPGRAST